MKKLKFLLVTNVLEISEPLLNKLNTIGLAKTLEAYESSEIINYVIRTSVDVIFLDVDYLGYDTACKIYNFIENITGKVCFFVGSQKDVYVESNENFLLFNRQGYFDYNILKIDLLTIIIDSLNRFNHNKILRNEKCYDYIYIVWEDLNVKKVEIKNINEILKVEKAIYMLCSEKIVEKRVINISFEMLYKLLNKNFEKSRYKITNKDWIKNNSQNDLFLNGNLA